MPWRVDKQDGKFCVVKESDGKVVKCHDTRKEANSHLAALYVNEPSASKKSLWKGYGLLKSLISERVEEIKSCGANKPGGGGFTAGNSCARGGGSTGHALTAGDMYMGRTVATDLNGKEKLGKVGQKKGGMYNIHFDNGSSVTRYPKDVRSTSKKLTWQDVQPGHRK